MSDLASAVAASAIASAPQAQQPLQPLGQLPPLPDPQLLLLQPQTSSLHAVAPLQPAHTSSSLQPEPPPADLGKPVARPLVNKIFIGGLAPTTTSESLTAYFTPFGAADCIVMMDRSTGRSRGFGFCTFASADVVQLVFDAGMTTSRDGVVEHIIDGKLVSVKACEAKGEAPMPVNARHGLPPPKAVPLPALGGSAPGGDGLESLQPLLSSLGSLLGASSSSSPPSLPAAGRLDDLPTSWPPLAQVPGGGTGGVSGGYGRDLPRGHTTALLPLPTGAAARVFVGGLPQTCDDAKLHSFFTQFGVLSDAKVMFDRDTGRSRGFGYVSFATVEGMQAAMANHAYNKIDDKWIEVKRCEERGSPNLPPARISGPLSLTTSGSGSGSASCGGSISRAGVGLGQAASAVVLPAHQSRAVAVDTQGGRGPSAETAALASQIIAALQGTHAAGGSLGGRRADLPPAPALSAMDAVTQLGRVLPGLVNADPAELLTTLLTPLISQLQLQDPAQLLAALLVPMISQLQAPPARGPGSDGCGWGRGFGGRRHAPY